MSTLKFAETHNLVVFLSKPKESVGFEEIVDFLNARHIKYALTVNPTIYTSCIQQFWATTEAKTVNDELHIQALVDKKKVIITEKSVRSNLHLEDAEGCDCLPNATIFEELTRIGAMTTAWNEFSSTMASAIICLATNQKFNFSKYIFDNKMKNLEGGVKFLMYPREGKGFSGNITPIFAPMMVEAPKEKKQSRRKQMKDTEVSQPSGPTEPKADETENVKSVPIRSNDPLLSGEDRLKLTKLMELCTTLQARVLALETTKTNQALEIDNEDLGDQEDASKQGGIIDNIDADEGVTLVDEIQERYDVNIDIYQVNVPRDEDMLGVHDLGGEEVVVEHVDNLGVFEVTTANATTTIVDELTLAQTLMEIKAAKPKAVTTAATKVTPASTRPRAKGIFFHDQEEQAPASTPIISSSLPSQLP
ncbi:hypothetical protein Tco_1425527 [Tanacetum coccineum]